MTTKIKGHSGCRVDIVDGIVRKTTFDKNYIKRLQSQCEKQNQFFKNNTFSFLKTPQIFNEHIQHDAFSFDMEFCFCSNYIDFFERASKKKIDLFFSNLVDFISKNVNDSKLENVSNIIWEKYLSVKNGIIDDFFISANINNIIFDKFEKRYSNNIILPIGFCHGDLTFSNILIKNHQNQLVFLDFLDTFLDTPLQDMVKIRQDTKFLWSNHLVEGIFDVKRIEIIMEYLDQKFHENFTKYDFYIKYYKLFEILNWFRVLRYSKDISIIKKIENYILND